MRYLQLIAISILFLNSSYAHAENTCMGFQFGCEKPQENSIPNSSRYCNAVSDLNNKWYCYVFQCDSSGNFLQDSSSKLFTPPSSGAYHGKGQNLGWISGAGYECIANCCYNNAGEFLGHINTEKACQNLCCQTKAAYLARDCSKTATVENTPVPHPTEEPRKTPRPEPTPPDGIIESQSMKDLSIGF